MPHRLETIRKLRGSRSKVVLHHCAAAQRLARDGKTTCYPPHARSAYGLPCPIDFSRARLIASMTSAMIVTRPSHSRRCALQPDGTLSHPKTVRSRRNIGAPAIVLGALRRHRARQSEIKRPRDQPTRTVSRVCRDRSGHPGARQRLDDFRCAYRGRLERASLGTVESGRPTRRPGALPFKSNTPT